MPRNKKTATEGGTALPSIPKELIDQFVTGPMSAEAVQAASIAFKKALIECAGRGARTSSGLSGRVRTA
jgi:putative transposase